MSNNENERTVRRVLFVRLDSSGGTCVRLCVRTGDEPHHAHAEYRLAPGTVVSVDDDVPVEAIHGGFMAFHWYRRVGDQCVTARGDGTLYGEPSSAD
jgi:hypothetical protein